MTSLGGVRVSGARLLARLDELALVGPIDGGGSCRLALTDADRDGRDLVVTWMRDLGLDVVVDAVGNVVGTWQVGEGRPVMTGSHIDTVRTGGRFDGNLGVLAGIEVIETLMQAGLTPPRPLAVAFFTNEEGARFQPDMLGSLVYVGGMSVEEALDARAIDGPRLGDELERIGYRGPLPCPASPPAAFVELHVEQGRGLIDLGHAVAVGTAILPHGRWRIDIGGQPNHAGTTRMADRRDPMVVFARLVLAAQAEAAERDIATRAARATIGKVACTPNAVNAVPAHVTGWLDARAEDEETLDALLESIARDIATPGITVTVTEESRTPAQYFDVTLSEHVAGLMPGTPLLATGAGHDAGVLAEAGVPAAMLFVRNPTGISHSPEEHAEDADCETGGRVLADVLADLLTADTLPR